MDHTYLTLLGWIPYHATIDMDQAYFMYNPIRQIIVNKNGIMRDEVMPESAKKLPQLATVSFDEVPDAIITWALELSTEFE